MNARIVPRTTVWVIAIALLGGCASQQDKDSLAGAGLVGALGTAVGAAVGGSKGAAIGAAVGLAGGATAGHYWSDISKSLFGATPATGTTVTQQPDGSPKIVLGGDANFAPNSTALLATGHPPLDTIAAFLKAHPDATVELRGYTDSSGNARRNELLSQKRAQSVADYLTQIGVPPNQVKDVKGYGSTFPLASNSTVEGRSQNRRVELYLHSSTANLTSPSAGPESSVTPQ